ncbi:MAG: NADAR family protein, partial [Armatimonadota bacterium]
MAIYFYSDREEPYGGFSNFSRHGFTLDGKDWPTSEHYFQAQKFVHSPDDFEAVLNASRPMRCAEIGRERHRPAARERHHAPADDARPAAQHDRGAQRPGHAHRDQRPARL